jgi:hypothetical protein
MSKKNSNDTIWMRRRWPWLFSWSRKVVVRFEVLTVATMKNTEFWNVTPCRLADKYRLFRETYRLQLHFNTGCHENRRFMIVLTKNPQWALSSARSIHFLCTALFSVCQITSKQLLGPTEPLFVKLINSSKYAGISKIKQKMQLFPHSGICTY